LSDERYDPYDDSIPISQRMGMQRLLEPRPVFDPEGRFGFPNDEMTPDIPEEHAHHEHIAVPLPANPRKPRFQRGKRRKKAPATPLNGPLGLVQQPVSVEPSKPPLDRRETASTACEVLGLVLFSAGFWLIGIWLGLIVTGLCLIVFGVATSNLFTRPRD
jgi:hypothetical protein